MEMVRPLLYDKDPHYQDINARVALPSIPIWILGAVSLQENGCSVEIEKKPEVIDPPVSHSSLRPRMISTVPSPH
jgi:hypothetical protein